MTIPEQPRHAQPPATPSGTAGQSSDRTLLTPSHVMDLLMVADADLPPRALSLLAEQIHQLSRGNAPAVKSYIQQLMNTMHSAQPDQVTAALSALAWLPADVRTLIEQKIRARHAREQQHEALEAGLNALAQSHNQKQDRVHRIISYLKSRFEALLQSGALRAAREAGRVLFHHGVVNDPGFRITLSEQQELGPSRTPGMAIARNKGKHTPVTMTRTKRT